MKNYLPMLIVAALLSVQLTYLAPSAAAGRGGVNADARRA
jgi:hypothetical protein